MQDRLLGAGCFAFFQKEGESASFLGSATVAVDAGSEMHASLFLLTSAHQLCCVRLRATGDASSRTRQIASFLRTAQRVLSKTQSEDASAGAGVCAVENARFLHYDAAAECWVLEGFAPFLKVYEGQNFAAGKNKTTGSFLIAETERLMRDFALRKALKDAQLKAIRLTQSATCNQ